MKTIKYKAGDFTRGKMSEIFRNVANGKPSQSVVIEHKQHGEIIMQTRETALDVLNATLVYAGGIQLKETSSGLYIKCVDGLCNDFGERIYCSLSRNTEGFLNLDPTVWLQKCLDSGSLLVDNILDSNHWGELFDDVREEHSLIEDEDGFALIRAIKQG